MIDTVSLLIKPNKFLYLILLLINGVPKQLTSCHFQAKYTHLVEKVVSSTIGSCEVVKLSK